MLARSFRTYNITLLNHRKRLKFAVFKRNVQITVVGAASDIGCNLSLLLKMNSKVTALHLHDDDDVVKGVGMELAHVPGGPIVKVFSGVRKLGPSLTGSDIIVMTSRTPRKPGQTREEMLMENALPVQNLCRAVVTCNPNAFLTFSTNPINSIIPFASTLLVKLNCYNPCKVLGITHIDTSRTRTLVGDFLQINAKEINVPVIGGHSDQSIIPLLSNMTPSRHRLDAGHADTLTRLIKKAGTDVVCLKGGKESATLAMAWSILEFVDGLIDAVSGEERVLNCYTVNPHFGTRYFSGPTTVGAKGIVYTCSDLPMNDYESRLLEAAVPLINRDVAMGEQCVRYMADLASNW